MIEIARNNIKNIEEEQDRVYISNEQELNKFITYLDFVKIEGHFKSKNLDNIEITLNLEKVKSEHNIDLTTSNYARIYFNNKYYYYFINSFIINNESKSITLILSMDYYITYCLDALNKGEVKVNRNHVDRYYIENGETKLDFRQTSDIWNVDEQFKSLNKINQRLTSLKYRANENDMMLDNLDDFNKDNIDISQVANKVDYIYFGYGRNNKIYELKNNKSFDIGRITENEMYMNDEYVTGVNIKINFVSEKFTTIKNDSLKIDWNKELSVCKSDIKDNYNVTYPLIVGVKDAYNANEISRINFSTPNIYEHASKFRITYINNEYVVQGLTNGKWKNISNIFIKYNESEFFGKNLSLTVIDDKLSALNYYWSYGSGNDALLGAVSHIDYNNEIVYFYNIGRYLKNGTYYSLNLVNKMLPNYQISVFKTINTLVNNDILPYLNYFYNDNYQDIDEPQAFIACIERNLISPSKQINIPYWLTLKSNFYFKNIISPTHCINIISFNDTNNWCNFNSFIIDIFDNVIPSLSDTYTQWMKSSRNSYLNQIVTANGNVKFEQQLGNKSEQIAQSNLADAAISGVSNTITNSIFGGILTGGIGVVAGLGGIGSTATNVANKTLEMEMNKINVQKNNFNAQQNLKQIKAQGADMQNALDNINPRSIDGLSRELYLKKYQEMFNDKCDIFFSYSAPLSTVFNEYLIFMCKFGYISGNNKYLDIKSMLNRRWFNYYEIENISNMLHTNISEKVKLYFINLFNKGVRLWDVDIYFSDKFKNYNVALKENKEISIYGK